MRTKGFDGVPNYLLSDISLRYNARLQELYQLGYRIEKEETERGVVMYRLISEPDVPKGKAEAALSLLIREIENTYDGVVRTEDLVKLLDEKDFTVRRKIGSFNK